MFLFSLETATSCIAMKLFIFALVFPYALAYDCPFNKIKLGINAKDLEEIGVRALGQNEFGGSVKFIFVEFKI